APPDTCSTTPQPVALPEGLTTELLTGLMDFVSKNLHIDCAALDRDGRTLPCSSDGSRICQKNGVKDTALCKESRQEALALIHKTGEPCSGSCALGVHFSYIPVYCNERIILVWQLCEQERKYNINSEHFRLAQRAVMLLSDVLTHMLEDGRQYRSQLSKHNVCLAELKDALSYTVFENDMLSGIAASPSLGEAIEAALAQIGEYFSLSRVTVLRLTCDFGEQKLIAQWMKTGLHPFAEYCEGECGEALWQGLTQDLDHHFDKDGFSHCADLAQLPAKLSELLCEDNVGELLHALVKNAEHPVALIVFERDAANPAWDDNRLTGLKAAAAALSGPVLQKLALDYARQSQELMYTIADGNGSATYAVDAKTRRILFMNRAMQNAHPDVQPGDLCTCLEQLEDGQFCAYCPLERFGDLSEPPSGASSDAAPPAPDAGQSPYEPAPQIRMEIYKSSVDTWYELLASRFTWFTGNPACLISLSDINARKVFELEVEKLAYYDAMLDIPNRACLMKVLQKVFDAPEAQGAVIILDLDDFKYVNDTLGSQYGDELLRRIVQYFNESDQLLGKVFRFGGDEFFILLQDDTLETAKRLATQLLSRFGRPWRVFDVDCTCTVSLGIAGFPHSGSDPKEIVASGEFAIYDAKATGKNRYVLYDEVLSKKLARRHKIQEIMRRALKESGFEVYYQPIYNIEKGRFTKAEALLRLHDDELGFIPPDEFIGIAEEIGLIIDIGLMVVDQVCKNLCDFAKKGIHLDSMAINISPLQLVQENFVDSMWGVISRYELPPTILEFEITENVVIRSFDSVKKTMTELQRYGISFALDDFGSGYSGLNYLLMLPISSLKIDKSYINQLEGSVKSRKMLSKIIELVQDFNMQVVAEGVETMFQDNILKQFNCDFIQGYLYSRPLPRADFELLVLGGGCSA
ncbi:MAG: putative bifunctional diguanylate cyclase/phosphodiesterase, partial [Acetanaerobacterium sp.]